MIFPTIDHLFFDLRESKEFMILRRRQTYICLLVAMTAQLVSYSGMAVATQSAQVTSISGAYSELAKSEHPSEQLMNDLAKMIEKDPTNYQAHFLLAICYQRIGLPDESLPELKLAVQNGPEDPAPILGLIREASQLGQSDLAAQVATIAHDRFPKNPEVQFWQANFVLQRGDRLGEADILFKKLIRSGQSIPNLKLSLGQLRFAQKKYDEALSLANEQLAQSPYQPAANLLKGNIYMMRSDYQNAYVPLKRAYARLVFTQGVAKAYAEACFWTGHYQEALEPAIVRIALAAVKGEQDKTIETIFKQAAQRVPKDKVEAIVYTCSNKLDTFPKFHQASTFHRMLAQCLSSIGMHTLAVTEFQRGVKSAPDDPAINFLLARELELYCGKYDQALDYYKKAKIEHVDVKDIDLYIEHLQTRIRARQDDLAWQIKDWLHGN
jgi:tetratricopeptide (TPR) repeat protein